MLRIFENYNQSSKFKDYNIQKGKKVHCHTIIVLNTQRKFFCQISRNYETTEKKVTAIFHIYFTVIDLFS
jgi:hypothetical protein